MQRQEHAYGGAAQEEKGRARPLREMRRGLGPMNIWLLALIILLIAYGLVMLFSASISAAYAEHGNPMYFVIRQFRFTLLGLAAMFLIAKLTPIQFYHHRLFVLLAYGVTTLLLLWVAIRGITGDFGAQRWISIAGLLFQPSELVKVSAVYCLAAYQSLLRNAQAKGAYRYPDAKTQLKKDGWLYIIFPGSLMLFQIFLIALQPHLSGAIIVSFLVLMVFLAARIPWRIWKSALLQLLPYLILLVLLLVLVLAFGQAEDSPFASVMDKFSHVQNRLTVFLRPEDASSDQKHQVLQSRLALGAGGFAGKGLGMSRQKSGFLPMVYNDYILPAIGEELGYVGTASITLLFSCFLLLGSFIALRAKTYFASLMAWGYTVLICLQAFLNIAVAAELIPATGISLPFFSYGGTSTIFFLVASGFILAVSRADQGTPLFGTAVSAKREAWDRMVER